MPRRPRPPRLGDYLMTDDLSGVVHPRSRMVTQWDGAVVEKRKQVFRNPQEFVKSGDDPRALSFVRPAPALPRYCPIPFIVLPLDPSWPVLTEDEEFLLTEDEEVIVIQAAGPPYIRLAQTPTQIAAEPSLGTMEVGCTFFVFPPGYPKGGN